MPEFYEKMKNRLRTAEQGADTASWLAISEAALKQPSGLFFEGLPSIIYLLKLAARFFHYFPLRSPSSINTFTTCVDSFYQRGGEQVYG